MMHSNSATRIAFVSIALLALSAFASGSLLRSAHAEPWSTPGAGINFVITGPGSPQVSVHNVQCPAIQVMASTGSATSCEFEIARTEPGEPASVDISVTATIANPSSIELNKFTFDVAGVGAWGFNSLPQVIATEPSWPWSTTPWTFASTVSWTDLSNASLGGSVTLVLQIDLTSDEPTPSPSPSPSPTPTLPGTGGTPTPTPTLPDTSGQPLLPGWPQDPTGSAFLLIIIASLGSIAYLYLMPSRRRRTR